ncbi:MULTISPECIES: hypothetical protein [Microbacterium]|uniref:hypothetical protein n=1 Tax=Microbacterium TaxID=33882 RepID=UPI001D175604|nr:hypothetical protein [Microbacterium testaceum]MCC4250193.1 hypothetical protein [Microbacterium testaceum]
MHLTRAVARARLDEAKLSGWTLNATQTRNSAIQLCHDDLVLRFLHSTSAVPAPGRNFARRAWYTNSALVENEVLFAEPERLLMMWGADFATGTVNLHLVHTVAPWDFGKRARIDMFVPVDSVEDFESAVFDSQDEEDLESPSREEAVEGEGDQSVSA